MIRFLERFRCISSEFHQTSVVNRQLLIIVLFFLLLGFCLFHSTFNVAFAVRRSLLLFMEQSLNNGIVELVLM